MSGRIRTLKPEMLEDAVVAGLSDAAFRLFVSMILMADDYGNLHAHPRQLAGKAFWSDESPSRDSREGVDTMLGTLARVSLVVRYRVRGQEYVHLAGWERHQKVDRPGKPRVPQATDGEAIVFGDYGEPRETPAEPSRESRESLATDLRPPTSDLRPRPPSAPGDPEPSPGADAPPDDGDDEPDPRSAQRADALPPAADSPAGRLAAVLRTDPQLAPIVPHPNELAARLADADAYPAVDVVAETKRAAAWLAANPKNRKRNGTRFLTGWMSRAQERAPPARDSPGAVPVRDVRRGPLTAAPASAFRDPPPTERRSYVSK